MAVDLTGILCTPDSAPSPILDPPYMQAHACHLSAILRFWIMWKMCSIKILTPTPHRPSHKTVFLTCYSSRRCFSSVSFITLSDCHFDIDQQLSSSPLVIPKDCFPYNPNHSESGGSACSRIFFCFAKAGQQGKTKRWASTYPTLLPPTIVHLPL